MSEKKQSPEVIELANNVFDAIVDIERAYALVDMIYEDYFTHSELQKSLAAIGNRYSNISLLLSTAVGQLHDALETMRENDLY